MKALHIFTKINTTSRDNYHVSSTYEKWDILLGNLNMIYAGRSIENIYCSDSLSNQSDGFSEGIQYLCNGNSGDIITADRFQELCEKQGLKQESKISESFRSAGKLKRELKRLEKKRKKEHEANKSK